MAPAVLLLAPAVELEPLTPVLAPAVPLLLLPLPPELLLEPAVLLGAVKRRAEAMPISDLPRVHGGGQIAYAVGTDAQNNAYVASAFAGDMPLSTGTLTSAGSDDIFVVKLAP